MSDYKSKQLQASCWIPRPGADKRTCRRFISRILFGYLFIFDEFVVRGNVTVIATFQQSFNSIRFLLRELVRSQTGSISNDLVNMHAVYNGVRWVPICSWLLHYFELRDLAHFTWQEGHHIIWSPFDRFCNLRAYRFGFDLKFAKTATDIAFGAT